MKVITYSRPWYKNPLLLPVAGVLVVMFYLVENTMLEMSGLLFLVLLAQVILFVLLLRRPIWAVAALIVGQLTACNYMFPVGGFAMSVRFFWTVLAPLLIIPILWRAGGIEIGNRARQIIIPAVIFTFVAMLSNLINTDLTYAMQYFRLNFTLLVILVLVPAVIKNERDLKRLAIVALITGTASAIFAMTQYLSTTGMGVPLYEIYSGVVYNGRVTGLSESPVQLGFNLPMILLPLIAFYYLKGVNSGIRKLLVFVIVVIFLALYFTLTRSGIYSLVPGILFLILMMKGKPKRQLLIIALVLSVAFLLFMNIMNTRYARGFEEDSSAAGRLILWQGGLFVALDNPVLGIGFDRFEEVSQTYAATINPQFMRNVAELSGEDALGVYEAHNDFITVWASFGTVALLAYLWAFVAIFRNFLETYRKASSIFLKCLALGCFAALLSYIVNAFTHNVMGSSMIMWILGGISIASTKLVLSKRLSGVKETR